jgi:hypothetical protein
MFFERSCRFVIMWKKSGRARQASDDNIIRRMRFACCMIEDTNTHSEYVILIVFPQQHWLRKRTPLLRLPVLLTVGTRQRWLVSHTRRLLYRRCNVSRSHCLGGRVGPSAVWTLLAKRKHLASGHLVRSLVTTPITAPRLYSWKEEHRDLLLQFPKLRCDANVDSWIRISVYTTIKLVYVEIMRAMQSILLEQNLDVYYSIF